MGRDDQGDFFLMLLSNLTIFIKPQFGGNFIYIFLSDRKYLLKAYKLH